MSNPLKESIQLVSKLNRFSISTLKTFCKLIDLPKRVNHQDPEDQDLKEEQEVEEDLEETEVGLEVEEGSKAETEEGSKAEIEEGLVVTEVDSEAETEEDLVETGADLAETNEIT